LAEAYHGHCRKRRLTGRIQIKRAAKKHGVEISDD
jgi:hypothetical protein